MEFKDQLRIAREAKGWSQAELAIHMEVSGQAVIWWELGVHNPSNMRLRKLEGLLNVRFNMTGSEPLEGGDGAVFGLGKDVVLLAQRIALLPLRHRNALEVLVEIGSEARTKKRTSFITAEKNHTPKKGFITKVKTKTGEDNANSTTTGSPKGTKKHIAPGKTGERSQ